jgi:hypothetical protein
MNLQHYTDITERNISLGKDYIEKASKNGVDRAGKLLAALDMLDDQDFLEELERQLKHRENNQKPILPPE